MFSKASAFAAALALSAATLAPVAASAEKTMRMAIWLPTQLVFAEPTVMFVDHVNEVGKGVLQINLVGPDAIPGPEQSNALRTGLLDMATLPPGLYKQQVPLGNAQDISDMTVAEQKANGAYDYMREMTKEQLGAYILTTYGDGVPFHIYADKEISSLEDLKGLRLRGSPIYNAFFSSLGISSTSTSASETYTALERGVVNGVGWPLWGVHDLGWEKFIKTRVDPGFYNVTINILVNEKVWEGLTDEERKVLEDAAAWLDAEMPAFNADKNEMNLKIQADAGIVSFDAGPDLPKQAADIYWGEMAKIDAEGTAKLRALFQK
ncbi:TRAP transporter substrate-binding protein DctP [Pseudodonghicola flavimaris]|uniref:TRAP transporter substrate-binding protein DctP n=1 Tax=Pseudodonghicola flavimaris TaxID=3050036 RepID=A0ABT7F0K6_9RHOB|nr:TRAP transporter substrate-binding protein DctP [Pseudodonghicola flavimaris]MDK3018035.1 TRAP transporter substrate-binding protein DctP [Pseudodonghicola flavimaris]